MAASGDRCTALICRSSYRGVIEFLRDPLGISISVGTVCDMLRSAARQAGVINQDQDLSGIRMGLHDEIFQGSTPVLAGVDAASTYCYLLVAAEHRDADTWGEIPCHGDVFHIQRQYEGLAKTLSRFAKGARSRRQKLEERIDRTVQRAPDDALAVQLDLARQTEVHALWLARDIRTPTQWLSHDVLALAGAALATRQALFDFIVEELANPEPEDPRRTRPVRVKLQNQRDELLGFVGVLDDKLVAIAHSHEISMTIVR